MAVLSGMLSQMEIAKRRDPSGKTLKIVEILNQVLEMGRDAIYKEGNLPIGHQLASRTFIPRPSWVAMGEGVTSVVSETEQDVETFGQMLAKSDVPKDVAEIGGSVQENLLAESVPILHGIEQEFEETVWYGNRGLAPKEFDGYTMRFNDLSGPTADNIIDGGGVGSDNCSMWMIGWGEMTTWIGYPQGSKGGIEMIPRGLQDVTETAGSNSKTFLAYRTYWSKKCGVVVRDWRTIIRGANIDVSELRAKSSAASDLTEMLIKMWHRARRVKGLAKFWRIYMNSTCNQYLDIQKRDDVGVGGGLSYVNVDGEEAEAFRKIPVRISDSLLPTESAAV